MARDLMRTEGQAELRLAKAEPDAPVGLSCRVYGTATGLTGAPTIEQLLAVLS